MKKNRLSGVVIYFLIIILLIVGVVSVLNLAGGSSRGTTKRYSEVIEEFDNLNVSAYELDLGSGALRYQLKSEGDSGKVYLYSVPNVNIFINDINSGYTKEGKIANYRLRYNEANPESPLAENYIPISDNSFLMNLLPYLFLVLVMVIFTVVIFRQSAGGGKMNSFSRANVRQQRGK